MERRDEVVIATKVFGACAQVRMVRDFPVRLS